MKYSKSIILAFACLNLISPLYAQLSIDDYDAQEILTQNAEESEGSPFSVSADFEVTGNAKFEHGSCRIPLDYVQFGIGMVDASAVIYYNPCHKEGFLASAGYTFTRIYWRNPYLDQYNFNTLNLALAAFSDRACNWTWKAQVQVNADLDHFNFADYICYDLLLAGTYHYREDVGLHFGFIALTGYKIDRLYPILGFDWRINDTWRINAVFPVNMSIIYNFTPNWSVDLAARAYEVRHRVGKDNYYSRGLVEYRAGGVEFGVNYQSCDENLEGNLHGGYLLGGKVKVSNRHHKKGHHYPFGSAPYVGGDITYKF